MTPSNSEWNDEPAFDSRDSEIFISDGPGDTTVRPIRPHLLKFAIAEREKIARWEALLQKQQTDEQPTEGPNPAPR